MSSNPCSFSADTLLFGPAVDPCRREFDFTLLFEELFFQLLPSCVFILVSLGREIQLLRRPRVVASGGLHTIKLIALIITSLLCLAFLISICKQDENERTKLSIPVAVLSFIASIQLVAVSHFEHTRSYRPSPTIALYLSITLLLRISAARTYALINRVNSAVFAISLAIVSLQVIVLVLEQLSKTKWFITDDLPRRIPRENSAGFWSRGSLHWLNRLLVTGYRRPLRSDDLCIVDSALASSRMVEVFHPLHEPQKYGSLGLLGSVYHCLGLFGLVPVLPRLCMIGFTFAQPFLAFALISYLQNPGSRENDGYGLVGATILVYGGLAISQSFYVQLSWQCATKIRGGLVGAINSKMLRLPYADGVESKVLALIINDAWRIVIGTAFSHDLWAAVVETTLGTWLLWRQVGPASLAVLGVVAVSLVLAIVIGSKMGGQQSRWLSATESRLEATKSLLTSLKAVKMTASGQRARLRIEERRLLEFAASRTYRALVVGSVICAFTPLTLAPVVVLGTYVGTGPYEGIGNTTVGKFDTARIFSSLILIGLIANPLIHVFQIIPSLGTAVGCAKRVEGFLRKEELTDERCELKPKQAEIRRALEEEGSNSNNYTMAVDSNEIATPILSLHHVYMSRDGRMILKDVSFQVCRGQHIAITGPVGCGKSLLLQAILGEVTPDAGSIHLQAGLKMGYCAQIPWLENTSAWENVFKGAPECDETWWRERVINACALSDLMSADGARGQIGSRGSRISGGEKQRLSIARAIASRPSVLLLDDVFSAIDRSTKEIILDQLFGKTGIVTEQGTTVVQITHDGHIIDLADSVYLIDQEGKLAPYQLPPRIPLEDTNGSMPLDRDSHTVRDDPVDKLSDDDHQEDKDEGAVGTPTEEKEHADPASVGDREVYRVYFGTIGGLHMGMFVSGLVAFAVTLKFPDLWVRFWTFDVNQDHQTRSTACWIGLYAFLGVLSLVVSLCSLGHLALKIIPRSGVGLHGKLIRTVVDATFAFVSGIDSGSIMNRFNQDLMLVDFKLPLDLFNTMSTGCVVIVQVVLVALGAVYSLSVIPVVFAVILLIQHFYLRTSKRLRQLDLETKSELHTKISESYQGIVTIRAHGWETRTQEEFLEKLDKTQNPQYLLWMVQTWLTFVLNMVVTCLAAVVSGIAVSLPSKTSAGALGVAFVNMTTLGEFLTHVIQSWTSLETSLGAIARIEAFEKQTPVEKDVADPVELPPGWPSQGRLCVDHLWASYGPVGEKPAWALQDVTLKIQAGERVAVCGRSGSGKSTLLLSLLGLIEMPRGVIRIDGIDISRVPKGVLRSRYFVISQDNFLLGETTREILDPEGRYTDNPSAIESVLSECAILDKVNQCGGLSGSLKEATLSVGEAQLFALARAILCGGGTDGGLVLFDEATSSIDRATEQKIMRLMAEKLKGKTIISVRHRLEAALEYDKIVVLEKGRVLEVGSPIEIVRKADLFWSHRETGSWIGTVL